MNLYGRTFTMAAGVLLLAGTAMAAATVGQPAPEFSLKDSNGKTRTLAESKGKWVVLEWVNYECPFVKKHYGSQNMQGLQKTYTGKDIVWYSVNSSATGKQGFFAAEKVNELMKERGATPTAYLLDTDGKVGTAYGAKTTPHMFIIDPKGVLVYAGGIDDKPSTDPADIASAKNFVKAGLDEALAGKQLSTTTSTPYGCSVKY